VEKEDGEKRNKGGAAPARFYVQTYANLGVCVCVGVHPFSTSTSPSGYGNGEERLREGKGRRERTDYKRAQ
jgi:hypothetical protein